MRFRFIGHYPAGRSTISYGGVTWYDRGSAEVTDQDWIRRLTNHIEFEVADDVPDKPKRAEKAPQGDIAALREVKAEMTAHRAAKAEVAALRAAYVERFGKKPWGGWDAGTLLAKLGEGVD